MFNHKNLRNTSSGDILEATHRRSHNIEDELPGERCLAAAHKCYCDVYVSQCEVSVTC